MSEGVSKEACFGFHNSHIMYEIFLCASITNVFHIYYIIILNTYSGCQMTIIRNLISHMAADRFITIDQDQSTFLNATKKKSFF